MKKNKKTIRGLLGGIFGLLFCILYSILFKWAQTGDPFTPATILVGTICFLNFIILGGIGYKIFKSSQNKSSTQLKKKFIHSFILFVLVAFLVSLSIVSLGDYIFYLSGGFETDNFMKFLFRVEFPSVIKQLSIWILIASLFLFYTTWRQAIEREQKLREENLKYRYRTLKAQINPHFLFNSLNTLSEIVYIDARKADIYIQKLSRIYRYILDNEETDLVPLDKEIEFVGRYLEMQKERDGNKIQPVIDVTNADKFKIIPVSLQLLAENALKHNSVSEENPLEIRIYDEAGYIVISNTIQKKNVLSDSCGLGLSNLKERVKLIINKEIIINRENNRFTVKLPLVDA